ncbi:hypothetical protein RHRU231_230018 [Rhodococcus ruber]|uniref:Uncharacterized protein n=1 Tax=Rhodococcus ruber TaxID=1830 RepID=A0A098BG43_9NOCA|nr:hypothetical protein RHRU231_230018 [Rhodococcus ruber]
MIEGGGYFDGEPPTPGESYEISRVPVKFRSTAPHIEVCAPSRTLLGSPLLVAGPRDSARCPGR